MPERGSDPRIIVALVLAALTASAVTPVRAAQPDPPPAVQRILEAREPVEVSFPHPAHTWIEVRTRNFTLLSNAGKKTAVDLGRRLERFRTVLARTSVNMSVEAAVPTRVYVFKTTKDFGPYRPGTGVAGFFLPQTDVNLVALDASAGNDPLPVIYHEFVHVWLDRNLPGLPLWLGEGLAEFYSTLGIERKTLFGGGRTIEIGQPVLHHAAWLQRDRHPLTLEELLTQETGSLDYDENERTGRFYAKSWVLAHYLMMAPDADLSQLNEYMVRAARGGPPVETFEEAFRTSVEAMSGRLDAYIEAGRFRYGTIELEEDIAVEDPAIRELAYDEVLTVLAELLLHVRPSETAAVDRFLLRALHREPGNARAAALLARHRYRTDDPDSARVLVETAAAAAPDDPAVYWHAGIGLLERADGGDRRTADIRALPRVRRAQELFRTALELDPDHYAATVGLGRAYLMLEDTTRAAAELLSRAYDANPARLEVLLDWIRAEARAGETDRAWDLVDTRLRPRGISEAVHAAEVSVARAELALARRHFEAGDREEGTVRLQTITRRARNDHVREMAVSYGESIVEVAERNEDVTRFNEIVNLANAGDRRAALDALDELIPRLRVDHLQEAAGKLRDRLVQRLRLEDHIERYNEAVALFNAGERAEAGRVIRALLADDLEEGLRAKAEALLRRL